MRWVALGVDYEMAGKDLINSVTLSSKICRALGGTPPEGFNYELFLDETGQKISKSKGNGLTIDDWLAYASPESLSQFMFQKPRAAKRLYFDVIPRAVDDYYQSLDAYPRQDVAARLVNPVWHIHHGAPPEMALPIPFSLLLNIASASNAEDDSILWGFISRHWPDLRREEAPALDQLVHYAVRYYNDFVRPKKRFRAPDAVEREALAALDATLAALPTDADAETIQSALYDVGRSFERFQTPAKPGSDGRPGVALSFFSTLYELLLGTEKGSALRLVRGDLRHRRDAEAHIDGAVRASSPAPPERSAATHGDRGGPRSKGPCRRGAPLPLPSRTGRSVSPSLPRRATAAMSVPPTAQSMISGSASVSAGTAHSTVRPRRNRCSAAFAMRPQGQVGSRPQTASTGGTSMPPSRTVLVPARRRPAASTTGRARRSVRAGRGASGAGSCAGATRTSGLSMTGGAVRMSGVTLRTFPSIASLGVAETGVGPGIVSWRGAVAP